jgi:autophagy-related protein 2
MVDDDLPTNPDYLDDSFSATAGLRELEDEDLDEFDAEEVQVNINDRSGLLSAYGGETIRLFDPKGLKVVENYYETLPPQAMEESAQCAIHYFYVL